MVLRTHADHTVDGAYVAGLAIPWGDYANDPGGYHMVWCRDGGEIALALAAAGHADDAASALGYLAGEQNLDGSWPRCFYVSRVPAAFDPQAAVQLDEVAFPLLLAGKLAELGVPLPDGTDNAIIKAAGYLARNGPVSGQDVDRWEENPGASPFTIGLEIVAMLVAATRLTGPDQALARALADNWNERLEEFTYVSGDEVDLAFGTDGHYVRIGLPGGGRVALANQPPGTQPVDAAALVGLEFGYLPRLGLRDPADKRITDTLAIVEAMLAADTPTGAPTAATTSTATGNGWTAPAAGPQVRHRPPVAAAGRRTGPPGPDVRRGRERPAAGDAGHARPRRPAARAGLGQRPAALAGPASRPAHRQRDAAGLGAQRAGQARGRGGRRPASGSPWSPTGITRPCPPRRAGSGATPPRSSRCPPASLVVAGPGPFTLHYGFNDWNPVTISERDAQPLGLVFSGSR